jgi:hypothetical protein
MAGIGRKGQTRREAGTQSHGSPTGLSRAAETDRRGSKGELDVSPLRKTRRVASATIALSLLMSAASLSFGAAPAAAAATDPLGVYVGAADPGGVRDFDNWLGRDVDWAMDFFAGDSWQSIEAPNWWVDAWADKPYKMIYSVPILPDGGGNLQQGASGAYNDHFTKLAQLLVAKGEGDAVLRLGWEFNGNWFRWAASSDPAAFIGYWRQIVTTMRAVPGANFKFDWCPNGGPTDMPADRAYPGDAYVDYIGMDFYDAGWAEGWQDPAKRWTSNLTQPFGLQWQRDFAAAHDKPMSYGEWGLWVRDDGHGGGDDPYFIQKMHDWIMTNDVAYAIYFEHEGGDGLHLLENNQFPKSAAKFIDLFGPDAPAPAPSETAPAPAPTSPAPEPTTPAPAPTETAPPTGSGPGGDATPTPTPSPTPVETPAPAPPGGIVGGPAPDPTQDSVRGRSLRLCRPCLLKSGHRVRHNWAHRVYEPRHHKHHRRAHRRHRRLHRAHHHRLHRARGHHHR